MRTLAIVGPTASGKSALALQVARRRTADGFPTEVVAVDAFTVYRGMDIGTAKASPEERAEVPHHLVDVLEPWERVDVVSFRDRARATIGELRERGVTPLLVGGSGLYWRAVVDPLDFPPTEPAVRARIEAWWGGDAYAAYAHLTELDPDAAGRIQPNNLRRIVRALEVIELTGQRFSTYDGAWQHYGSIYDDLEVACLEPPSALLRTRIAERARQMVDAGLLDEVWGLSMLPVPLSATAEQAIGYAEALAVLEGRLEHTDLADAIEKRTWRYARRQRAWFRADPRCRPPSEPTEVLARWCAAATRRSG